MREFECPGCGARIIPQKNKNIAKCEYCGTVVNTDDAVLIRHQIVDEARIKELELEQDRLKREEKENEVLQYERKKWRKYLFAYLGALVLAFTISSPFTNSNHIIGQMLTTFTGMIVVFGGIGLYVIYPKGEKEKVDLGSPHSSKSKTMALILCVFLGVIGGHYFYVGRYGRGVLYLFTYGLFCFGWIIDIFKIANGTFTDNQDLPLIV